MIAPPLYSFAFTATYELHPFFVMTSTCQQPWSANSLHDRPSSHLHATLSSCLLNRAGPEFAVVVTIGDKFQAATH